MVSRLRYPTRLPAGSSTRWSWRNWKAGPNRRSSTNCTIEYSSSSLFSSGVPVSTIAYRLLSFFTSRDVFASQFLIRCASSSTTTSGAHAFSNSRSRTTCS